MDEFQPSSTLARKVSHVRSPVKVQVAPEKFVRPLAGQDDFAVSVLRDPLGEQPVKKNVTPLELVLSEPGIAPHRNTRSDCGRVIRFQSLDDLFESREAFVDREDDFGVIGSQVVRDDPGSLGIG